MVLVVELEVNNTGAASSSKANHVKSARKFGLVASSLTVSLVPPVRWPSFI